LQGVSKAEPVSPNSGAGPGRDSRGGSTGRRASARLRADQADPRAIALDALTLSLGASRRPLDDALDGHPDLSRLDRRDRAFARLLALTCVRRLGQIDAVLREFVRVEPRSPRIWNMLRLGAVQLLFLGTPGHAAVNETVRLAKGGSAGMAPMLNAVLRRVAELGPSLLDAQDAARLDTPDWLWGRWSRAHGEGAVRAIAEMHLREPPRDIRVKGDPACWVERLGGRLLPGGTIRQESGGLVEELPGYDEGAWWIQDFAATLPAAALGDLAGQPVLDLGAAPGGKTLQLAAAGGRVTAVEVAEPRAERLRANLARTRLDAEIVVADARAWRPHAPFPFVLLDAPCTATGTIRRHPDIAWNKRPDDIERLVALQNELMDAAFEMVAPGGTLVYAVCSLEPEEGPQRVEALLGRRPELTRDALPGSLGDMPGQLSMETGEIRTLPLHLGGEGGMDGFYVARLRRRG
jgi:16S rRNA (cytosine967-C5)-methyltransferase